MSQEPVRLAQDPNVAEELRSALGQMAALPPQPYEAVAGLARLQHAIQASPATAVQPTPGGSSLGRMLGLGAAGTALLGGVVAVVVIALRSPAPPPTLPAVQPLAEASSNAPQQPVPTLSIDDLPTVPSAGAPTVSAPLPPLRGSTTIPADQLYREELLHLANLRSVAGANPSQALRLAEEGHTKFARGMLYQEREAIAIGALSRLGRRGEARARGEQFLARFPRSPFAAQVRRDAGLGTAP